MRKKKDPSRAVDVLLYALAIGSVTGAMLASPNALIMLEKPLGKLFENIDEREKRRKISQLKSYLKTQGLVRGDYDHGIELTAKARRRIDKFRYDQICVQKPDTWDRCWRLILFDIPEESRYERVDFTQKLKDLGFQLLQQSVWVHPYPSKEVIYRVAAHLGIDEWVTYIETSHIDNSDFLERRFRHLLANNT